MKLKRGTIREDGMVFVEYRKRKHGISEYWTTKSAFELILKRNNNRKRNYFDFKTKYQSDALFRRNYLDKKNKYRRTKYNNDVEYKKKINNENIKYSIKRKKADPLFKLIENIRSLVNASFKNKNTKKDTKTESILGCSFEEFKSHIESQFQLGMSWDNRRLWHIDHIMPVSMAKTEDEIIRLNHHRNLRPLWAHENLSKSDKTPEILVLF